MNIFRPEDTHKGAPFATQQDLNKLFWTHETCSFKADMVLGKCTVVCSEDLQNVMTLEEYFDGGPDRFYFTDVRDF